VRLKKSYCIASILTELLFEEFRLAIPIWRFFLRVIEHTSDTLDLLKIIHECPYYTGVVFLWPFLTGVRALIVGADPDEEECWT
jgi:hypothetical protein